MLVMYRSIIFIFLVFFSFVYVDVSAQTLIDKDKKTQVITPPNPALKKVPPKTLPKRANDLIQSKKTPSAQVCAGLMPQLNDWWYPGFDWDMVERYGHDKELYVGPNGEKVGNGIIDLPNTKEYVMNRVSSSNTPDDACGCPEGVGNCEAKFRVNFETSGVRKAQYPRSISTYNKQRIKAGCPAVDFPDTPQFNYIWEVDNEIVQSGGEEMSVCLPEGFHAVTLRMDYGIKQKAVTRNIEVIDHLIVNLGDSYGAGEGVPEKNYRPIKMRNTTTDKIVDVDWRKFHLGEFPFFAQWADPGIKIPMKNRSVYGYREMSTHVEKQGFYEDGKQGEREHVFLEYKPQDVTYKATLNVPDWNTIKQDRHRDTTYKTLMDHHHAHRSSAAAASQLAYVLERDDPKSSVTFVNLAASGATIEKGVLGRYNGVNELKLKDHINAYIPIRNAVRGLLPQVDELDLLLQTRDADDIYLSVGGNDVGFASIITLFLTAWSNFDITEENGNIKSVQHATKVGLDSFNDGLWTSRTYGHFPAHLREDVIGLDGLGEGYRAVNETLRNEKNIDAPITLISYPNFGSVKRPGEFGLKKQTSKGDVFYCDLSTTDITLPLGMTVDFDPIEFKLADERVFKPLSKVMLDISDELGWTYLDQGELPQINGICGEQNRRLLKKAHKFKMPHRLSNNSEIGSRWYRTPDDGAAIQRGTALTNNGLFHPNEYGYKHVARLMQEGLKFYGAEFVKDKRFNDQDDSISEAKRKSVANGTVFTEALSGSNDVHMFKITMTNNRCSPTTVNVKPLGNRRPLTITAFGANGEVLASTSRTVNPTPPRSTSLSSNPYSGNSSGSRGFTGTINKPIFNSSSSAPPGVSQSILYADAFCPVEAYENHRDGKETASDSTLTFIAGDLPDVYIGVSYTDNVSYDPVTGRGDNREDIERAETSFRGLVTVKK